MNLEKGLENWSSVKKYTDEEISQETLEKIFDLTTNAPTAFNLQPYRFLVLDSEEAKEKAVSSAVPVNGWMKYADKIVVLVAFEDLDRNAHQVHRKKIGKEDLDEEGAENRMKMFADYKTRDKEFLTGWLTRNTMIPATFFMLACQNYGIGSCPVRGFSQEQLTEKLDLEENERPMLLIPIGYPKEESREWRRDGKDIYETK